MSQKMKNALKQKTTVQVSGWEILATFIAAAFGLIWIVPHLRR